MNKDQSDLDERTQYIRELKRLRLVPRVMQGEPLSESSLAAAFVRLAFAAGNYEAASGASLDALLDPYNDARERVVVAWDRLRGEARKYPAELPVQYVEVFDQLVCEALDGTRVPGIKIFHDVSWEAHLFEERLAAAKASAVPQETTPRKENGVARGLAKPKLPALGPHDKQAWQLSLISGMKQKQIADELNKKHGTLYGQGQISRMIARVIKHADASELSDRIPTPLGPEQTMDPSKLTLGARIDKHTLSQRSQAE